MNWWQFAVSLAGPLIAGSAGVYFGMRRFKSEHGFQARLEWYRELLASLHAVAQRVDRSLDLTDPGEFNAYMGNADTRAAIARFDLSLAAAPAFAKDSRLGALNRMEAAVRAQTPDERSVDLKRSTELTCLLLEQMKEASEAVAGELRDHLGLGTTNLSSWPFARAVPVVLPRKVGPRHEAE